MTPNSLYQINRLTRWVNEFPKVPEMVGQMGLFTNTPIDTRIFGIDRTSEGLVLIPASPVGSKGTNLSERKGKTELFECTYHAMNFQLNAQELSMVRAMGSEGMETPPATIARKLRKTRNSHLATWEHLRVGAIKGVILDADGTTVIANLFTRFGLTQITTDYVLGSASTDILTKNNETKEAIEDAAGGIAVDNFLALCGSNWFNRFVAHPNVQKAYLNYQEASSRIAGDNRKGFVYGGVEYRVYNGKAGTYRFIGTNEAYMFPQNVPDMFEMYYCPPNHVEFVNQTPSDPILITAETLDHGAGYDYQSQSNPFAMNNYPHLVAKLTTSN